MKKKAIRILLADDHAVLREGLKALVQSQPDMVVVGEAADGEVAQRLAQELRPDVVVMDISMMGGHGGAATRKLRTANPGIKVLALTVHEDSSYLQEMLGAGASGYVLKRAATRELVHALRVIAQGGTYIDPAMSKAVVESLTVQKRTEPSAISTLSEREVEIAKLISQGYTQKEIANLLSLSTKTIETHKTKVMEKLQLRSRSELVRFAYRSGWLSELQSHQEKEKPAF